MQWLAVASEPTVRAMGSCFLEEASADPSCKDCICLIAFAFSAAGQMPGSWGGQRGFRLNRTSRSAPSLSSSA